MSNIFYTSDTHFNHDFVARDRGFASAEEHDEHVISLINRDIRKNDHLWILGDVFMGNISKGLPIVDRLKGKKHLVLGNHDAPHPMHRNSHSQLRRFYASFESVHLHEMHRVLGREVMLSHFPYKGDHAPEDRHTQWRLPDEGKLLLHGHVHKEWQMRGRQMNVGVDSFMKGAPVPRDYVELYVSQHVSRSGE